MLAIDRPGQKARVLSKCSPHIVPCRIRHDGPVNASKRYWNPQEGQDGSRTAYFRGRKLCGKAVKLPHAYRGVILNKTERAVPSEDPLPEEEEDVDGQEKLEDVMALDEVAEFDAFTIWGHEALPDDTENPLTRGISEWMKFAEAMHSQEFDTNSTPIESR